ncbi:MAG: hypothetical protein GW798_12325 [Roseovarius sp.]|nr:hypothetical protein [Roseovarius sp.]
MSGETDYRMVTLPGLGQVRIPAGMTEAEVLAMLKEAAERDMAQDHR